MAEASFSAYVLANCKAKTAHFGHFEATKGKGGSKKEDQNWSCFFLSKSALVPQFEAIF